MTTSSDHPAADHRTEQPAPKRKKTPQSCLEVAFRLLGRRDFGVSELTQRLMDKGFERDEVTNVVARLQELGAVDDARYARILVSSRARLNRWGRRRIQLDMQRRLLDEQLITQTLNAWEEGELEEEAESWTTQATNLLTRRYGRWQGRLEDKEFQKRMNFLLRRGYSYDQARQALAATREEEKC